MSGQRVVGWFECMARVDPAAIQRHRSRDPRKMEISVPSGLNINLPAGIWISVFYLEQQDEKNLALRRMRNAHCHRRHDGTVSFFVGYDRPQRGGVRAGAVSPRGKTDCSTA